MLWKLVFLAALFGFLFGFDEGVIAVASASIIHSFDISSLAEGFMTAAVPLGAVGGAVAAALWSDTLGRRRVLLACSVLFGLGSIMSGMAPGVGTLTAGRLVLGLAIGASAMAAPLFLAELAPAHLRGAIVSAFQLMITVGILVSYLTGLAFAGGGSWRLMLSLGVVPAAATFAGMWRAPESPRWLVLQDRLVEATTVLRQLQPGTDDARVRATVEDIAASAAEGETSTDWRAFLAPSVFPVTAFAMLVFLLQQVSGINAVIYYAPRIIESSGFTNLSDQLLGTVAVGLVNVVMTVVAMALVDRLGRRPMLIWGFVGTALFLAMIAWAQLPGTPAMWGLIGLFGYIGVFAVSLGPLPWIYMSELFPLHLRARGMALASIANWVCNFLVVFLFPVTTATLGTLATMLLFSAFCVAGAFYAWRKAPETMGESLESLGRRVSPATVAFQLS